MSQLCLMCKEVNQEAVCKYVFGLKKYYNSFNKSKFLKQQYSGTSFSATSILYCWFGRRLTAAKVQDLWALSLFIDIVVEAGVFKAVWKKGVLGDVSLPVVYFEQGVVDKVVGYKGDVIYFPWAKRGLVGCRRKLLFPMPCGGKAIRLEARRMSQLIPFRELSKACQDQDRVVLSTII